jgi:hypothetical protein
VVRKKAIEALVIRIPGRTYGIAFGNLIPVVCLYQTSACRNAFRASAVIQVAAAAGVELPAAWVAGASALPRACASAADGPPSVWGAVAASA